MSSDIQAWMMIKAEAALNQITVEVELGTSAPMHFHPELQSGVRVVVKLFWVKYDGCT